MKTPNLRILAKHGLLPLLLISLIESAQAQTTYTWDGGGANNNLNTADNWTANVVPVAATNNDFIFAGSTRLAPFNGGYAGGTGFRNITFASGAGAFNITGDRFTINGDITNNSTTLQTVGFLRALADNLGIIWQTGTHTINAASGDILITGCMQDTGGVTTLNKTGNFTLSLTNEVTSQIHTWDTNVQQGIVRIARVNQLGYNSYSTNRVAGQGFTVSSGATLAVGNGVTDGEIATMLGTTNFAAGSILGFDTGLGTAVGNRAYTANITDTAQGQLSLLKMGSNTLTLSGTNTFTGNTTVSAGVLTISSTAALPGWDTNGRFSVASGAMLAVGNSFADADVTTMRGTTNFIDGSSLGFDTSAGDRSYGVNLTGAVSVAKVGANTLTLTGTNTYTGSTMVAGGVLSISSTAALPGWDTNGRFSVASGAMLAVSNSVADADVTTMRGTTNFINGSSLGFDTSAGDRTAGDFTGAVGVGKAGANTLNLTGTNTYTGSTMVAGGTLKLGSALTTSGALKMTNSGILDLNGKNATFTTSTALGSNTATLATTITDNGAGSGTSVVYFNDNANKSNKDMGALIADGTTRKVGVKITNGAYWNSLLTNANSTYSGGTLVAHTTTGGGSRLAITDYTPSLVGPTLTKSQYGTGAIIIGEVATDHASIYFDTGFTGTFHNGITFNTPTGLDANWKGVAINVAGVTLAGTQTANLADAIYETFTGAGQSASITGRITGSQGLSVGPVAFVMNLTLTNAAGTNDYAGDTKIGESGRVTLGANDQIPDGVGKGNVIISANVAGTNTGTLRLNGFNETINGLTGNALSRVQNNSATTASTLTLGANDTTASFAGNISNGAAAALAITKIGTGTQTFSGTNTYTGNTDIQAGTLAVAGKTSLPGWDTAGRYSVAANATLAVANDFSDADITTMLATGNFNAAAGIGFYTGAGDRTYAVNLAGARRLVKEGANTLVLTGTNTYTDGTWINGGSLELGSADAIGSIGTISFGGGALRATASNTTDYSSRFSTAANQAYSLDTNGQNVTWASNLTSTGGSLTKSGSGILTISGTNTYTGKTAVSGGTLQLGSALTTSGALQMSGTGILDLNGNNATFITSAGLSNTGTGTNTITDNAAGTGTSVVFFSNLASQDDKTMGALITDGATRKVGVKVANANYYNALLTNADNTYSGGTTITAADSYGARYILQAYNPTLSGSTLTNSELGTGTFYVGANATDKASFIIDVANKAFQNDFVWDGTGTNENRGQLTISKAATTTFNGTQTLNTDLRMSVFGIGPAALVINGKVTGNGGLTLAAPAPGFALTLTLQNAAGTNDYAGLTNINRLNEFLILGADNQIPDGSGKGNVNAVGTFRLNGFNDTINGLTGTGTVQNNSETTDSTLTLGAGDATATFSGSIADGAAAKLALVKTGTGTQILTGASNSYTGNTTVNAGTLEIYEPYLAAASSVSLGASAVLNLNFWETEGDITATVDTLFINGVQKPAGIYGATGSGATTVNDVNFDGVGTLTVLNGPAGANYASWASDNGISGQPFDGDFDKDGISNGVEYALGKSPTTSSQPAGVLAGNTLTFTKGAAAIANGDVSWIIETSTTLTGWSAEVTQAAGDPAATITYTFTPGTPAKKFARLKVVQVP